MNTRIPMALLLSFTLILVNLACKETSMQPENPVSDSMSRWTKIKGLSETTVRYLASDNTGQMYAFGTHPTEGLGLCRSSDAGTTWVLIRAGDIGHYFVAPNGGLVVLGVPDYIAGSVYLSQDHGDYWEQIKNLSGSVSAGAFLPSGRLLLGWYLNLETPGGVSASDDGGTSWTSNFSAFRVSVSGLMKLSGDSLLLSGRPNNGPNLAFFRSTDGGSSWSKDTALGEIEYAWYSWRSPKGTLFAGSSTKGLLRRPSNSHSWQTLGFSDQWFNSLAFSQGGIAAFAISEYRPPDRAPLYFSFDDGVSWFAVRDTVLGSEVYSVMFDSQDHLFAATRHGLFRTATPVTNWQATFESTHSLAEP